MNSPTKQMPADGPALTGGAYAGADAAEATLRLLARLPAPEGLEDRLMASLRAAPKGARVLRWPAVLQPGGNRMRDRMPDWLRGAAAAAIVFLVAGGGWGVYSRVQPGGTILIAPRAGAAFAGENAERKPRTLNGPVLAKPLAAQTSRKAAAPGARAGARHSDAAGDAAGQPSATASR